VRQKTTCLCRGSVAEPYCTRSAASLERGWYIDRFPVTLLRETPRHPGTQVLPYAPIPRPPFFRVTIVRAAQRWKCATVLDEIQLILCFFDPFSNRRRSGFPPIGRIEPSAGGQPHLR